jgi:hypothetical protein
MVTRNTVIEATARAIATASRLDGLSQVLTYDPNRAQEDASVRTPTIALSVVANSREDPAADPLAGYTRNADGAKTGRIFERAYRMELQADIYTLQGDGHDPDTLADDLATALRRYNRDERGDFLEDADGNALSTIRDVRVTGGQRADDLTASPTIRRWRSSIEVRYINRLREADEYGPQPRIKFVNHPHPGDLEGAATEGVDVEYVPSEHPENTT